MRNICNGGGGPRSIDDLCEISAWAPSAAPQGLSLNWDYGFVSSCGLRGKDDMTNLYQRLLYCCPSECSILVAACGPCLHTFHLNSGNHTFTWSPVQPHRQPDTAGTSPDLHTDENVPKRANYEAPEPQQKRRKLSIPKLESGSSAEIIVNGVPEVVQRSETSQVCKSVIVKLAATSTGQYVVSATGEDKTVRVFKLSDEGILTLLNERRDLTASASAYKADCNRCMPKRPCAIIVAPDDSTILCADKFGDVYALPLIELTPASPPTELAAQTLDVKLMKTPPEAFVPSATTLTVHTMGNREALRQQQRLNHTKSEKKSQRSPHKLLLGHVSLLTDVVCAKSFSSGCRSRDYILTCDRDEHIRLSRGSPQAHIIESYCLGHTNFVSKLCVLSEHGHLLLSGGGDDYLLLWEWLSGTIKQTIELKSHVERVKHDYHKIFKRDESNVTTEAEETHAADEKSEFKTAVSNIVIVKTSKDRPISAQTQIMITCEG